MESPHGKGSVQRMKVPAIVLAGGKSNKKLLEATGSEEKAFIRFGGKPMVFFVVDTLLQSPSIEKVVVVGNEEKLRSVAKEWRKPVEIVRQKGEILDNFLAGCEVVGDYAHVLASSCDIPLITPAMVEDFLQRCSDPEVDIYYPVVEQQLVFRSFPHAKRTFARLREGTYTGGNLILLKPVIAEKLKKHIDTLIRMRKSPLRLASLLGWGFVLRFFLGRVSIQDVEEKIYQISGVRGKALEVPYAEIGMDLDKIGDFLLFEGLLTR